MFHRIRPQRQLHPNKHVAWPFQNVYKKAFFLFVVLIFCLTSVFSQNFNVRFDHLTKDNGLSQNTIEYIYKDSRGFVWFATRNGLNRYDGYSFKIYKAENSPHGLSSNFIHCISEDLEGNLWVGTENGLNVFDTKTNTFTALLNKPENSDSLSDNTIVTNIVCDKNGIIWAGTFSKGLIRIQKTTNATYITNLYQHKPNESKGLSNNTIHTLFLDKENMLWIGTENGVNKLCISTNTFEAFRDTPGGSNPLSHNSVLSIFEDSFGYIWIGTWNGLNRMNKATGELKHYFFDALNLSNSSNSTITTIGEDIEGNLLIGTINGLYKFVRQENRFYQFPVSSNSDYALSNELISCIETDSLGNVWIGTHMSGINHYNVHQKKFRHIAIEPLATETNNNNVINSIYTDPKTLWIGTAGSGLYCVDKLTGKQTHFRSIPGDMQSINGDYVSAIKKDNNGNLWVGTWESGLNRVHLQSKPIRFERISENNGWDDMQNSSITSIHIDSSFVLIGGEYGLDQLNVAHKKNTPVANNQNWNHKISQVRCILKDKQGFFWIGTRIGLYCFHEKKLQTGLSDSDITHYRKVPNLINSLPDNFIETLCEDSEGNIWAGTFGHGICQIQRKNNEIVFNTFDEKSGLSNNVIYYIQTDEKGNLWISTDYGLSRLDISTKKFINYYVSDGLLSNQFFWGASTKGEDGTLYFGGTNGICYFRPNEINDINYLPKVTITDFKLFNKSVNVGEEDYKSSILSSDISEASEIHLTYKENVFSIEFSALTYFQPQKIEYAYKLIGVDDDWIYVPSTQRFASYRNLDGGKYTFLVKASNSNGEWGQNPTKLDLMITPPFWDTLLFKILSILFVLFFIAIYFRYRTRILIIQKRHLEKIVENRTNEIACQKEQLAIQNQEITAQRDELIDLNKKVQHANQLKLRFFTNISHEFRTPLTLIAGPVKKLLTSNPDPDETKKSLLTIDRNAQRLIHLINELLDFRKVETDEFKLNATKGNLILFINKTYTSFEQLAQDKQIDFIFTHEEASDEQWFDHEKLENILFNLLSNAFKHTSENGKITISLRFNSNSEFTDSPARVPIALIQVTDTGTGIPAEHIDDIFKRFYQIDTPENIKNRGSGIGLSLTKDLVSAHRGTIHVQSEVGKGSTFTVCIPFQKESFSDNEISEDSVIWDRTGLNNKIDSIELQYQEKRTIANRDIKIADRPTLLIVEDNCDLREFVINSLADHYNILEAENGKTAYEIAKVHNPAIIISDIMMPIMDGLELCTRIKNNLLTSHIPVILLTARSLTENWIEGLESGADDYVTKPFDMDLLKAKTKNLLESREKLRKHFSGDMNTSSSEITTTKPDSDFIAKAFEIVEEHFLDPEFGVKELVDKMNVSHSLLHKKLKAIVNQSAGDFITIVRLKKAAELLRNSGKNITEVAYNVGFNDPKYFSQKFKRYFGILPSEYVKNN